MNDPDTTRILDTDIGSYVEMSRRAMHLHFKLVLLHQDYRNNVDGYQKMLLLNVPQYKRLFYQQLSEP